MEHEKNKRYTEEQINTMIDMYVNKGIPTKTIAKEFNTDSSTICHTLNKNGVSMRKRGFTDEQIHAIVDMYVNKGLATTDIAKEFNTVNSVIWRILDKNGIARRKTSSYDRKSETTKQMIDMYNSGMTVNQIADKLGKSYNYVHGRLRYHKILGKTHKKEIVHTKKKTYKYEDAIKAHINNIQNRNKSKVPNIEKIVDSEVTDVIAERTAEIERKLCDAMELAFALTDEYEQICIERTKILENEIPRQIDDIDRQEEELDERKNELKKALKYINK